MDFCTTCTVMTEINNKSQEAHRCAKSFPRSADSKTVRALRVLFVASSQMQERTLQQQMRSDGAVIVKP